MALTNTQAQYINWLNKNDPFLLAVAIKRATGKNVAENELGGLSGISDIFSTLKNVDFGKLATTIVDTTTKLATTRAQVQVMNAQTKRAIAGQPPIELQYYPTTTNFDPNSANGQMAINAAASQYSSQYRNNQTGIMNYLPWIILGIGGAIVITKLKGGSRGR